MLHSLRRLCHISRVWILLLVIAIPYGVEANVYISPTEYDYSVLANQITVGASTKKEKVKAIYDWICANIDYDTSYSIHTADECYETRKGVCQAYCELFYYLCDAVDVDCDIVPGVTKDRSGEIRDSGHSWVCVEIENSRPMLIDPTWGAGSVSEGIFTRRSDHSVWFDVDPYWLIMTHLPDDESYQLLEESIDRSTFARFPALHPDCQYLGLNPRILFRRVVSGKKIIFPQFYTVEADKTLLLRNIPINKTLYTNVTYRFEVDNPYDLDFALILNDTWYPSSEWQRIGSRYRLDVQPTDEGVLTLVVKGNTDRYNVLVEYEVIDTNK